MKKSEILYISFLASILAVTVFVGGFVAPTIFHTEQIFGSELLSHAQEGLIMTAIFQKFNIFLNSFIVVVLLYESFLYKHGYRDNYTIALTAVTVSTALLFTSYYTPQILEMISKEETNTELFKNTHFASELDIKLFTLALVVLIFRKIQKFQ